MSSAACYTNRRRVKAESNLTKVQYPRGVATRNGYLSTQNCSPNFSVLNYIWKRNCKPCPPQICIDGYDGGNSNTVTYIYLDGGNACTLASIVRSGGNATTSSCIPSYIQTLILSGGTSTTNPSSIYDGNVLQGCTSCIPSLDGEDANTLGNLIYSGENANTLSTNIVNGGTSTQSSCPTVIETILLFTGGNASTNSTNIYDGNT